MEMTVLDTLGKLADRGHRLFCSCLRCARAYDPKLGPKNRPSQYDIDLGALIAERGRGVYVRRHGAGTMSILR
jgi:hypothetical protein